MNRTHHSSMARGQALPAALRKATVPRAVLEVLRRLDAAGYRSWLVGGAVRDFLLHRHHRWVADFDVATPARPEEVTSLFRRVIPTGIEHGTVTVLSGGGRVEVTTFRGEGDYLDGRRPSSVTFHSSLEEDMARRDFTMNALAYDPIDHALCDPFGGQADIQRRLIRAVGDPAARFREDGLRPLRAVRFAAQLGFALERATAAAIPNTLEVVRRVSAERVSEELTKLVTVPNPGEALRLFDHSGLLGVVLPWLAKLPRSRVAHAMAVTSQVKAEAVLRYAALLHLLTPTEAMRSLARLRLPSRLTEEVRALVQETSCLSDRPGPVVGETGAAIRGWLSRVGTARARDLLSLWEADARTLECERPSRELIVLARLRHRVEQELRRKPPLSIGDLAIGGQEVMGLLGISAGREVGEALRFLLGRVIEDPSQNTAPRLRAAIQVWAKGRNQ